MDHGFDDLAKTLATAMPRREAMWRIGGIVGGAVLGWLGLAGGARAARPRVPSPGGSLLVLCNRFCARYPAKQDFLACRQVCLTCPSPALLCGNTAATLVCCNGAGFTCISGECVPPTNCSNGRKDGSETDVDCGGPICAPCANGLRCKLNRDCRSGNCQMGVCAP